MLRERKNLNKLMQLEMRFHRIVLVERNVLRLSSPSLLKQGQLQDAAQNYVQLGFECLHRWRHYSLSEQLVAPL